MESTTESLAQLATRGAFDSLEEKWLESMAEVGDDVGHFLNTATLLAGAGEKDRACVLLTMLYEDLRNKERPETALDVLRAIGAIRPNDKNLRPNVLDCVREVHKSQPGLELFIEKSELAGAKKVPDALDVFEQFTRFRVGCHVFHSTGWGTGQVIDFDASSAELTIDFEEDKGHAIPVESAREIFEILDDDDLRAYKLSRREELDALAKDSPAEVIKLSIKSRGGKAQASEIRNDLRESVIPTSSWSKWWTKARREAAKDSFIEIQEGTKPVYLLREKPVTIADEALAAVKRAKTLPDAVATARGFLRKAKDSIDLGTLFANIRKRLAALSDEDYTEHPGIVMETLIFLEDAPVADSDSDEETLTPTVFLARELRREHDSHEVGATDDSGEGAAETAETDDSVEAEEEAETASDDTPEQDETTAAEQEEEEREAGEQEEEEQEHLDPHLEQLLDRTLFILHDIGIQEYRNRFLAVFQEVLPEEWPALVPHLLCGDGADLWDLGITTLRKAGHQDILVDTILEVVEDPVRHADSYLPFARGFFARKYDDLPDMPTGLRVIRQIIKLYEKVQRRRPPLEPAELKKVLARVETLLLDPKSRHLAQTLKQTTLEEMTRIFHESEASPYLSPELKAAIHTTVARTHPVLLTADRLPFWEEDNFYCTEPSIDKKQEEFRVLTEIKIPANSRAVGAAAALGDLSENSEYTSALESQRLLTEKAEELRAALDRVRLLENQAIPEGVAVPGTRVVLRAEDTGEVDEYRILGPWDAGEDHSVVSYMSPLGRSLMGKAPGDRIEAELPGGLKVFTLESVEELYG